MRAMSLCTTTALIADGSEVAGPALDLGVAEAVEGELRLPGLQGPAPQGVAVGRRGGAEWPGAELAVLQHLGVPERDHGSGWPGDLEP